MIFAKRLETAMQHADKTRKQVAEAVGVSPQNIGMILTSAGERERSLNAERTFLAAKFLGVNPHWLATGEGEMLGAVQQSSKTSSPGLSAQATELATLFDLIPEQNRIARAKAYTKASQAILDELQATAPVSAGSEKLTA